MLSLVEEAEKCSQESKNDREVENCMRQLSAKIIQKQKLIFWIYGVGSGISFFAFISLVVTIVYRKKNN
ncbi:hypothetical protein CSB09_03830 [Candidatus Gracilibacteria bacterium]|nr:MAG: hypothetical protein CSB09_03830 [Candidatus Gracilibacteria bacterium]